MTNAYFQFVVSNTVAAYHYDKLLQGIKRL